MAIAMRGSPVLTDDRLDKAAPFGVWTERFTVRGAVTATCVLGVLLVAAAAFGWSRVEAVTRFNQLGEPVGASVTDIPGWVFIAALVGFGIAVVTMFKPTWARVTAPLYALAYGSFVGAISHVYDASYEGIVTQALFGTMSIFSVMLVLYATRIIKVTNRFVLVVVGATMGIAVMYLFAFLASLFGARPTFLYDGGPLAIGISLVIIVVGALNLAIDFAFIERAAQHQVPKSLEWYAGFGVMVTLVWIYFEVLRLLAMLRGRD